MSSSTTWLPAEPNLDSILASYSDPLQALSEAEMPAIIFRQAYNPDEGYRLIDRFLEQALIRDPKDDQTEDTRTRIDIGSSLNNRGDDKEAFLKHAEETHQLFNHLFEGFASCSVLA